MRVIPYVVCATLFLMPSAAYAEHGVIAQDAYAYATASTQKNGAVFGTLINHMDDDVHVLAAETDIAAKAELHTHKEQDGIMQMRQVESYVLKGSAQHKLEPTGDHIMLMGLTSPLNVGDEFEMTLSFDNQDPIIVDVSVVAPGSQPDNEGDHHDHSHH